MMAIEKRSRKEIEYCTLERSPNAMIQHDRARPSLVSMPKASSHHQIDARAELRVRCK
jgi:hypothetical protein